MKQSSTTGIINWNSFSVGKNNSVSFNNGSGATLNRVTGGNLSTIAGQLHATGSLYLMNSSGVIVSGTGHVVTGGSFVATSGNIVSSAFGTEDEKHIKATAAVINHGTITSGGRAALFGSTVTNTGSIAGRLVSLRGTNGVDAAGAIHATGSGSHDGRIVVIAKSGETKIAGALTARNIDGTGGHIETSGQHVTIGGHIDTGLGGSWLVDPVNLTVTKNAAATIHNSLQAGTNIELKTTSSTASGPGTQSNGPGDIVFASALSWNTTATLTLDAYHSVLINAPITVAGKGALAITTANGGDLLFSKGHVSFTDVVSGTTEGALTINGNTYELANSVQQLSDDIQANPSVNVALADNYDASSDGTYGGPPIEGFLGVLEGLGNVVKNLSIDGSAKGNGADIGLIKILVGTVRDFGLVNANVKATGSANNAGAVGALVGYNEGTILDSFSSGLVEVSGVYSGAASGIGGLVGVNAGGTITGSHATADVKGGNGARVGGLVGTNGGSIVSSYATGSVSGGNYFKDSSDVGGLVGFNTSSGGDVTSSYSTGDVSGGISSNVGGLIGYHEGGSIQDSHSSASPTGGDNSSVGGLVGLSSSVIDKSHATGVVTGGENAFDGGLVGNDAGGSITDSSANAHVTGGASSWIGGLVGYINHAGSITGSDATGTVTSGGAVFGVDAGGLVGFVEQTAVIVSSYATGTVAVSKYANAGGFAGFNDGEISESYATGKVSAGITSNVGGFVGQNFDNIGIDQCYSQGNATGGSNSNVGGFVGATDESTNGETSSGTITNSHATGDATGGSHSYIGSFAGIIYGGTTIDATYGAGSVAGGSGSTIGGFVGADYSTGIITNSYWDITNGIAATARGAGNRNNDSGIQGLSTTALQSGLPTGFDSSIWGTDASVNDGLPYLIALKSSY